MEASPMGRPQQPDPEVSDPQPSDMWAVLPEQLRSVAVATEFVTERHRWNTNEEVASLLVAFDKHQQWLQKEVVIRPPSGTLLFYSKQNQRYRKDGYFWKKRRDGKTTREDHMKLKVSGVECIYGCYVHSAILPTFHRRSYWLLQNPDMVLVHYLNVPLSDETPLPPLTIQPHKQQWEEGQLLAQLRPMFAKNGQDGNNAVCERTIQSIASTLLENQRRVECPGGSNLCKARSGQTLTYLSQKPSQEGRSLVINSPRPQTNKPLILNLSQLRGNNSLIILSSAGRAQRPVAILGHKVNETSGLKPRVMAQHVQGTINGNNPLAGNNQLNQNNPLAGNNQLAANTPQQVSHPLTHHTNHTSHPVNHPSQNLTPSHPASHIITHPTNHASQTISHPAANGMAASSVTAPSQFSHSVPRLSQISSHTVSQQSATSLYNTSHLNGATPPLQSVYQPTSLSDPPTLVQATPNPFPGGYGDTVFSGQNADMAHYTLPQALANQTAENGHMGDQMSAIAQVAESDMVVDSLIREMNLQQGGSVSGLDTMQISPTQSDLTLDDLDLSFLDNVPSPAPSLATYSSPPVTTVTSPSPATDRKRGGGILEFCPEWAYKDGGEKVLIVGPWEGETTSFAVLFDGLAVPAQLLQTGVLRCICPEHKPGKVKVEVVADGHVISNSVMFEYRSRLEGDTGREEPDWFDVKELQLRTWLLQRLQLLEKCMDPAASSSLSAAVVMAPRREVSESLELRLVECVQRLSEKPWSHDQRPLPPPLHGLTLLHLSAALGYTSLIKCLIGWRQENPNSVLASEINAVATDSHQATPLVWACALGHQEAASTLYQHDPSSGSLCSHTPHSAIDLAKRHGHMTIASKLQALEKARRKARNSSKPRTKDSTQIPVKSVPLEHPGGKVDLQVPGVCANGQVSRIEGPDLRDIGIDSQGFKVPASPLHSTPKSKPTDSLTVTIPPDLHMTSGKCRRSELLKRLSVEVLPNHPSDPSDPDLHQVRARSLTLEERKDCANAAWGATSTLEESHQVRARSLTLDEASQPRFGAWGQEMRGNDPMLSMHCRDLNSPLMFMDAHSAGLTLDDIHLHTAMDTESSCQSTSASSLADKDELFDSASQDQSGEGSQGNHQMATLANQIIAAMPERIKLSPSRSEEHAPEEQFTTRRDRSSSYGSFSSCSSNPEPPCAEDSGISTPLEGIAEDYRYSPANDRCVDLATPPSSLSPASSLHSPYMDTFSLDSPPPTAEEFNEYFNAPQTYLEKDFSQLTLSDAEQRNLYAAAKIIQNFYRRYKDRKEQQMLQRQREVEAVVLIQSYYRRYKQYRYYKRMSQAAVLIQSQFRSYYAQKRYRQRREAATLIQNRYRAYKEQKHFRKRKDAAVLIQQRFRNHYQRKYQKGQKSCQPGVGPDSSQVALAAETQDKASSSTRSETDGMTRNSQLDSR